ncbi:MAG: heme exporter protein CcmB [Burkholderiales bacterium]|jgi:heme exporter protein B|nr:heme exporter protein CcmB [Burkholderiales bacterium]
MKPARDAFDGAVSAFLWAVRRDLRIAMRSKAELAVQILFYIIIVALFPLSMQPDKTLLMQLGPGVLWVAALLSSLLSLPRLFSSDFADGTLEQMAMSPLPLPAMVLGKVAAHWITSGLPVVLLAPLLSIQYWLEPEVITTLMAGLLLGSPILSLLGAIGAALTLGLRAGGSLLALLVLPLYVPVLIFGAGAVEVARGGLEVSANFSLLGAGLLIALLGAPFAISAATRIALD